MAEDSNTTMNLDLNLGPIDNSSDDSGDLIDSYPVGAMNLEDWLDSPLRARHRSYRWRSLWRQIPIPQETRNLALELIGPQTDEGSIASDISPDDAVKACEEDDEDKKVGAENNNGEEGSFFDCNICLELSKDPVVTCCGHLFCWPCLYRWLHHHSDSKECPVCKGEVMAKSVTPIYGRGYNNNNSTLRDGTDSRLKIPSRPHARRVQSWRQAIQRSAFTIPMEEMIRRLGSAFDLSRELSQVQAQNLVGHRGNSPERSNNNHNNNNSSLPNRILTSRGILGERAPFSGVIDLMAEDNNNNNNNNNNRRISSLLLRRSSLHRATSLSNLASALQSAESLAAVESYFSNNPVGRDQGRAPYADDRDSVSSRAAVIQSESQTVDYAVEIDSTVSLSTSSSSRRRVDASRISNIDSGDLRVPRRRRRLN